MDAMDHDRYWHSNLVSLTKVAKKTKEQKNGMMNEVCWPKCLDPVTLLIHVNLQLQENSEKWRYCWLFEVGSMRNSHLKTVRKLWKECACLNFYKFLDSHHGLFSSARIFFGRSAVMAKALGTTPEEEHRQGLYKLAKVRNSRNPCRISFFL